MDTKEQKVRQAAWQRVILLTVLGYEGAGALLGGIFLIARPDGALMDMPVDIMHGAFRNFLIPGIILFALGILNVFAFVSVLRRKPEDWFMAALALGGFVIWFTVEIIILHALSWLHIMWGLPVLWGCIMWIPLAVLRNDKASLQKGLLWCGILSSLWYIAINIFVPFLYSGYHIASYTVSELSAVGAPTRIVWVLLVTAYPLLFAAFGWAVLRSAGENRPLRVAGYLVIAYCIFNLYWPPMHMRGAPFQVTDALHITWAAVANILMWMLMGFAAAGLSWKFRLYTIASIALHIVFGVLTFFEAPEIPKNGYTPMIGIWERLNIFIFLLWVIVFAAVLLKQNSSVRYKAFRYDLNPQ